MVTLEKGKMEIIKTIKGEVKSFIVDEKDALLIIVLQELTEAIKNLSLKR